MLYNDELLTKMWDFLQTDCNVSEETLQVVTSINGYNTDSLKDVLEVVTGYKDFDQIDSEFYDEF